MRKYNFLVYYYYIKLNFCKKHSFIFYEVLQHFDNRYQNLRYHHEVQYENGEIKMATHNPPVLSNHMVFAELIVLYGWSFPLVC